MHQHNQEWQPSDSKVSPVSMPSNLYDASTTSVAGSTEYENKDGEQEEQNMTVSDTHTTLDQACAITSYADADA